MTDTLELKKEILSILDSSPDKKNPRNAWGCLYFTEDPAPEQSSRCVIGQLFHNRGMPIDDIQSNPSVLGLVTDDTVFEFVPEEFRNPNHEVSEVLHEAQGYADGNGYGHEPTWGEAAQKLRDLWEL